MTDNSTEIAMPRLSDSMAEGTILTWIIAAGEPVAAGEDLVEIETDKATMSVQAEGSGVLEVLAGEGETLPVGAPIARLHDGAVERPSSPPSAPRTEATAEPPPAAEPRPTSSPPPGPVTTAATPLARRAAGIHGLDLGSLGEGSGPRGRITKVDVLAAAGVAPAAAVEPAPPTAVEGARGGAVAVEPTRLQAVIARRMAEAKATVPHFQVETEARVDAILAHRAALKREAGAEPVPSLNDFVVKAAAQALRAHAKANGSYRDGRFELHERINVGIAVAAMEALLVPTIADADRLSLAEIGAASRRLATRAREGTLTPPELAGGTFTVSNLGMFGMTAITPVVNPPHPLRRRGRGIPR